MRLWDDPHGPASGRLGRSSGTERGSGQRREGEAVLNFLSDRCFSWPASHTAKGSVPSWAGAQAEGRAGEGPLSFRQGGGALVVSEAGRHGELGQLPHSCWKRHRTPPRGLAVPAPQPNAWGFPSSAHNSFV